LTVELSTLANELRALLGSSFGVHRSELAGDFADSSLRVRDMRWDFSDMRSCPEGALCGLLGFR